MKKIKSIYILGIVWAMVILLCHGVSAYEAPLLEFQPDRNGKYIYCNNPEWIGREHLADNSNRYARFVMNNENLSPDKYAMFISLVNRTERKKADGSFLEQGFDIEVDVLFRAKENTILSFTAMGFEVPEQNKYYLNGNTYSDEEDLGCFTAWASYIGMPIAQLDSGKKYTPIPFEDQIVEIKAGEEFWLSQLVPNYRAVPFCRVVHLMSDFEILSGNVDVNIAALRSNGNLCDRSHFVKDAAFGTYIRENQHKGIADSVNSTDAHLTFEIDDSFVDGTKLPVTVVNQYAYTGNTVTNWFTNLNPRADIWNKYSAVESSLLKFTYKDPSKLHYYGNKVAEKEDVWYFDTEHADTAKYPGKICGNQSTYVPNFPLQGNVDESLCPNLGNYGVFQNYHVTVKNSAREDKYLLYRLNTVSNNLIILRDESGKVLSPYPITRGATPTKETDSLACVKLPAGKNTTFTLTVVLTTNHFGGMENMFVVSDTPQPVRTYPSSCNYNVKDKNFTEKECAVWSNGKLRLTEDGKEYTEVSLTGEIAKKVHGQQSNLRFYYTPKGYMVRTALYDGTPYYHVRDFYREVYLLDDTFTQKASYIFPTYPSDMSYVDGTFYVKAGTVYESEDFKTWKPSDLVEIPVGNQSTIGTFMQNGKLFISVGGREYTEMKSASPLPYVDSVGDLFYYIVGSKVYLSKNLIDWYEKETDGVITSFALCDAMMKTSEKDNWTSIEKPEGALLFVDGNFLGVRKNIICDGEKFLVPLRALGEAINAEVTWSSESGAAITYCGKTHYIKDNNISGTVYITEQELEEILGRYAEIYPDAIIVE